MRAPAALLGVLALTLGLIGCGDKLPPPTANAVAARVNGHAITLTDLNQVLQAQRGLAPEQVDAAARQVLENLIDRRLALEQAEAQGLDKDARVVWQLQSAREEVLAQAWRDRLTQEAAAAGAPEDILLRQRFDAAPLRHAQRRAYQLQELMVQGTPAQWAGLPAELRLPAPWAEQLPRWLDRGLTVAFTTGTRLPEHMNDAMLARVAALPEGGVSVIEGQNGLSALRRLASTPQPLTWEQARPGLERAWKAQQAAQRQAGLRAQLRAGAKLVYAKPFAPPTAASAGAQVEEEGAAMAVAPATAPPAAASGAIWDALKALLQ